MSLLSTILGMFSGKKKGSMPDLGQINEMKEKAADFVDKNEEMIDKVTDAIPGEADDQMVDKVKDALK